MPYRQVELAGGCRAAAAAPLSQDRELLEDFLHESGEHLRCIEAELLDLERGGSHVESLHAIFRSFHSIKGLAGFLDLVPVRDVAHEVEALLELVRSRRLTLSGTIIDVVLAAKDFLQNWHGQFGQHLTSGHEIPAADSRELVLRLHAAAEQLPDASTQLGLLAAGTSAAPEVAEPIGCGSKATERGNTTTHGVKVDTAKLDFLVDMAGEMMIAQSLIRHHPLIVQQQDARLSHILSQLARITGELQRTAMSLRMVPIGQLFRKMERLVRDLCRRSGKLATLVMEGETAELDRNVVEELADPLLHMVRNAVDHGLEFPEERRAAGKQPECQITLRATHQAGGVIVDVTDDGRGLDSAKILEKAIQNGLVAAGANLPECDVFPLIFQPGFSTAEHVTDVSGRGVGMDVVNKQIQKLRGRIEIHSQPGKGTTFRLRLPLTLAVTEGLIVRLGRERFILPIYAVREMLRPTKGMIQTIGSHLETVLIRGELAPLVRLADRLGLVAESQGAEDGVVVLMESGNRRYGLLVDELIDKQEVVIKSLGEILCQVPGITGGAILGDGRVGLILDPDVILRSMPDVKSQEP